MFTGITILCFAACYAIAFVLEIVGLNKRFAWHRWGLLGVTVTGFATQTVYLANLAFAAKAAPLSSPAEWLLAAAWVLVLVYLGAVVNLPRAATGVILLPMILVLIGAAQFASNQPFAPESAYRFWGDFHGWMLLLGTVTVCVGFSAGVMYLIQASWLKRRRPPSDGLRLPSLEWLERISTGSLAVSALLIGLGFVSGVILSALKHRGETGYVLWTDPVVISLAAMTLWLVAAELFRVVYPAARRGRKVAYLTLASFGFLVIALASLMLLDHVHGASHGDVSQSTVQTSIP
jgi:ABC-type transport system involved in cytochrome c biogenesis permease subunit